MKWKRNSTTERKRPEGKGKREGCCRVQGSGGGEKTSVSKRRKLKRKEKAKREYNYTEHEWQKWKWSRGMIVWNRSQKKLENRGEIKGKKDGGRRSHSHVEDGLLVSHHVAVSHRQGVIASLEVKILKRQLDHLGDSEDIVKTTTNDSCLNAPDTRCRGETPLHLWLSITPPSVYHLSVSSDIRLAHFHLHKCTTCV